MKSSDYNTIASKIAEMEQTKVAISDYRSMSAQHPNIYPFIEKSQEMLNKKIKR